MIGFAGAPFTLASYAVEGGSSKNYTKVKALMYAEPAAWRRLMTKLVTVQADYLLAQAKAGAQALQVFDSWAGLALSQADYRRFVQPYNRKLFDGDQPRRGSGDQLQHRDRGATSRMWRRPGGDVIGVDWRMPLGWFWQQIGHDKPIQGNLDPAALLSPWRELKYQVDAVLGPKPEIGPATSSTWATAFSRIRRSMRCGAWSIMCTNRPPLGASTAHSQ